MTSSSIGADSEATTGELDFVAQRLRARLREKMFGVDSPPLRIGRFNVLDCVGSGGMGIVYAVYDDRLDRKIAVKVLHEPADEDSPQWRRLVEEAQALAQLSHPNVVQVFEVGSFGGRVFLAMEYVHGDTLEVWQRESRPWRDVLEHYMQAGRGLIAAHACNIVHRDFKPANVLLGTDGRVRVADFGLARVELVEGSTDDHEHTGSTDLARVDSTLTGDVAGTPAYMSPEQLLRKPIDARSDQFSFCVALYEGLFGQRPHRGEQASLLLSIVDGEVVEPEKRAVVPRHVWQVLKRGLATAPNDRFDSMNDLLAALEHPARRRYLHVTLGAAVLVGLGVVATQLSIGPSACSDPDPALGGAWSAEQQAAISAHLQRVVPAQSQPTTGRLTAYAQAWVEAKTQLCDAEYAGSALDLRAACLERRKGAFAGVTAGLMQGSGVQMRLALAAVGRLPRVSDCSDQELMVGAGRTPPALARDAATVRASMDAAVANASLGDLDRASARIGAALARARTLNYPPLVAEALFARARISYTRGEPELAELLLEESAAIAEQHSLDLVAADALTLLVRVSRGIRESAQVERALRRAEAAVARLSGSDRSRLAALESARGYVAFERGDPEAAKIAFQDALTMARATAAPDPVQIAQIQSSLADALASSGQADLALPLFAEALTTFRHEVGSQHYFVAELLLIRSLALATLKQFDSAERDLVESRTIEAGLGPARRYQLAKVLLVAAKLNHDIGRFPASVEPAEASLAISRKLHGSLDERLLNPVLVLGGAYLRTGRGADARPLFKEALSIVAAKPSREAAAQQTYLRTSLGQIAVDEGRYEDAISQLNQAQILWQSMTDERRGHYLGRILSARADLLLKTEPDQAAAKIRAMLVELEEFKGVRITQADLHFSLAQALLNNGERAAALRAATSAKDLHLATDNPANDQRADAVTTWIAQHR